ncbi:unnamed protein product [Sympodiomycopsis kandeliae]
MAPPKKSQQHHDVYPLAIIDTGSTSLRISLQLAHDSTPILHTCPNAIIRSGKFIYIGSEISTQCKDFSSVTIRSPFEKGILCDWMAQKTLWDIEVSKALFSIGKNDLAGWNVILTESYFNLPELSNGLQVLFMEEYHCNSIWISTSAQLAHFQPAENDASLEASVLVDIGNSYTHVVPIIKNKVVWNSVRRLEIGGKMLTNLLKEAISFTQWDVMEESYIISHLKERSLFVAASDHDHDSSPSGWNRKTLQSKNKKEIEQEFVLPDYSDPATATDPLNRFGTLRSGPGSQGTSAEVQSRQWLDSFIANSEPSPTKQASVDDDAQVVKLSSERWQIPELLFHPQQIGLDALGLSDLISTCISHASDGDEAIESLMYGNVRLFGGLASIPGLRTRLEKDLIALSPDTSRARVTLLDDPSMAAIHGARHIPPQFIRSHLSKKEDQISARDKFESWGRRDA